MLVFSFNLIYVPKPTKNLKCQLMFNNNDCMIYDTHSKKMIGRTKLNGGLYILDSPLITLYHAPPTHSINTLHDKASGIPNNCNLWHLRLSHPSNKKLIQLHKLFPFIKSIPSPIPCDVCFYAKKNILIFLPVIMFPILHLT